MFTGNFMFSLSSCGSEFAHSRFVSENIFTFLEFHAFSAICTKHKTTLDTFTFSQLPRNNAILSTDGEVTAVVFTCSFLRAAQNAKTNNPSTHTHVKLFEFSFSRDPLYAWTTKHSNTHIWIKMLFLDLQRGKINSANSVTSVMQDKFYFNLRSFLLIWKTLPLCRACFLLIWE